MLFREVGCILKYASLPTGSLFPFFTITQIYNQMRWVVIAVAA